MPRKTDWIRCFSSSVTRKEMVWLRCIMPPAPSLSWSYDRNRYLDWLRGFQICQPFPAKILEVLRLKRGSLWDKIHLCQKQENPDRFGHICLAPCTGAEEIDFLPMIFFASGRTNAVIASNVSGFLPILSLLSLKTMFLFSYYIAYAQKKG